MRQCDCRNTGPVRRWVESNVMFASIVVHQFMYAHPITSSDSLSVVSVSISCLLLFKEGNVCAVVVYMCRWGGHNQLSNNNNNQPKDGGRTKVPRLRPAEKTKRFLCSSIAQYFQPIIW
ncbi:hypothetical protein Ddc_00488 [Ditylenchus destructor]|nr:hypothetical protein Ddc_00488 [Ditylenchus destructor]